MSAARENEAGCPDARRWRGTVERFFTDGLEAEAQRQVREHIRSCADCRQLYDRLLMAERLLVHDDASLAARPTHFEDERLFARIAAQATGGGATVRASKKVLWRQLAWAAPVMVVIALGAIVLQRYDRPPDDRDRFTQRGGAPSADASVRLLRLHGTGSSRKVGPLLPVHGVDEGRGRLKRTDRLVILVTNHGPGSYAFAFGIGPRWEPLWYHPAPTQKSRWLDTGTSEQALGRPVDLKVNHRPGTYSLVVLLSPSPLSTTSVSQAVRDARSSGGSPKQRHRLPLPESVRQVWLRFSIF